MLRLLTNICRSFKTLFHLSKSTTVMAGLGGAISPLLAGLGALAGGHIDRKRRGGTGLRHATVHFFKGSPYFRFFLPLIVFLYLTFFVYTALLQAAGGAISDTDRWILTAACGIDFYWKLGCGRSAESVVLTHLYGMIWIAIVIGGTASIVVAQARSAYSNAHSGDSNERRIIPAQIILAFLAAIATSWGLLDTRVLLHSHVTDGGLKNVHIFLIATASLWTVFIILCGAVKYWNYDGQAQAAKKDREIV